MKPEKIKHIEFTQTIITRMNLNSFLIKGWTITIFSGFLVLYHKTSSNLFFLYALPAVLLFWFLDTYYLQQERKFRGVYRDITDTYNLKKIGLFEMPIQKYTTGKYAYINVFFSKTLFVFYFSIIVLVFLFFLFSRFVNDGVTYQEETVIIKKKYSVKTITTKKKDVSND